MPEPARFPGFHRESLESTAALAAILLWAWAGESVAVSVGRADEIGQRMSAAIVATQRAKLQGRSRRVASVLRRPVRATSKTGLRPIPPREVDGSLHVYAIIDSGEPEDLQALAQAGLRVETIARKAPTIVQGWISRSELSRLEALAFVRAIRPVDRAIVRRGAATTEGNALLRADLVADTGFDGSGVTVGVISDGVDSVVVAQATGDLPGVTVPADAGCRFGSGDEGTALLEIVHDIAPGARLLFSGPGTSVEMIDSVRCLAAAGADVIVDDLGFLGEPYFSDGPVAQAVRAAVQAGVSYHSAAGNEAEVHLEQAYRQSPATTFHDFSTSGAVDNTDSFLLPSGGTLLCFLQWNDAFGASANDYDLYMLDGALAVVDAGIDVQAGNGDPFELAGVQNPSASSQTVHVVIDRYAGAPRRLKMFCFGDALPEYVTPAGSLVGHPALREVVAVGAIDVSEPGIDDVETYSARGPSTVFFPSFETRPKPDLASFDGVSISNAGGFPLCPPFCRFFGTSAAAPHAAAVAALALSKNLSLTPAALLAAMRDGTVDIPPAGFDPASGRGRLDALAVLSLVPAADCNEDTDCRDADACTTDTCGPSGTCVHATVLCGDDGNVCNGSSRCDSSIGCTPVPAPTCADADECTRDGCDSASGCRYVPLTGVEGERCAIGKILRPDVCHGASLPRAVERFLRPGVERAQAILNEAEHAQSRARFVRLVARAQTVLRRLERRLKRAADGGRVGFLCARTIRSMLRETRSALTGLRTS